MPGCLESNNKMDAPTKEITLPISNAVATIREWITNKEQQHIMHPVSEMVQITSANKTVGNPEINIDSAATPTVLEEMTTRKRVTYITKIKNGEEVIEDKAKILEFITAMPDVDVQALDIEIENMEFLSKKKLPTLLKSERSATAA